MRRREFITLLGGAAAWPITARAQQPAIAGDWVSGPESPMAFASRVEAFRQGLGQAGYIEGRNVAIEFRWAESQHDRLPALAAELVARPVSVIVAPGGAPAALAAKSATMTIPIVFEMGADPIVTGLVQTLNRPGGNITGVTSLNVQITPKRLEILHEAVPAATLIAVLLNPTSPTAASQLQHLQAAASRLNVRLHVLQASNVRDLDGISAALTELRPGGLVVSSDTFLGTHGEQLAALAVRHSVPAIHQSRDFADRRRPDELCRQLRGVPSPSWHPDRTHTQRATGPLTCQSSRSQSPAVYQPQDRESARSRHSAVAARPRGRGD